MPSSTTTADDVGVYFLAHTVSLTDTNKGFERALSSNDTLNLPWRADAKAIAPDLSEQCFAIVGKTILKGVDDLDSSGDRPSIEKSEMLRVAQVTLDQLQLLNDSTNAISKAQLQQMQDAERQQLIQSNLDNMERNNANVGGGAEIISFVLTSIFQSPEAAKAANIVSTTTQAYQQVARLTALFSADKIGAIALTGGVLGAAQILLKLFSPDGQDPTGIVLNAIDRMDQHLTEFRKDVDERLTAMQRTIELGQLAVLDQLVGLRAEVEKDANAILASVQAGTDATVASKASGDRSERQTMWSDFMTNARRANRSISYLDQSKTDFGTALDSLSRHAMESAKRGSFVGEPTWVVGTNLATEINNRRRVEYCLAMYPTLTPAAAPALPLRNPVEFCRGTQALLEALALGAVISPPYDVSTNVIKGYLVDQIWPQGVSLAAFLHNLRSAATVSALKKNLFGDANSGIVGAVDPLIAMLRTIMKSFETQAYTTGEILQGSPYSASGLTWVLYKNYWRRVIYDPFPAARPYIALYPNDVNSMSGPPRAWNIEIIAGPRKGTMLAMNPPVPDVLRAEPLCCSADFAGTGYSANINGGPQDADWILGQLYQVVRENVDYPAFRSFDMSRKIPEQAAAFDIGAAAAFEVHARALQGVAVLANWAARRVDFDPRIADPLDTDRMESGEDINYQGYFDNVPGVFSMEAVYKFLNVFAREKLNPEGDSYGDQLADALKEQITKDVNSAATSIAAVKPLTSLPLLDGTLRRISAFAATQGITLDRLA